jgi:hypothetical protein
MNPCASDRAPCIRGSAHNETCVYTGKNCTEKFSSWIQAHFFGVGAFQDRAATTVGIILLYAS